MINYREDNPHTKYQYTWRTEKASGIQDFQYYNGTHVTLDVLGIADKFIFCKYKDKLCVFKMSIIHTPNPGYPRFYVTKFLGPFKDFEHCDDGYSDYRVFHKCVESTNNRLLCPDYITYEHTRDECKKLEKLCRRYYGGKEE